MSTYYQDLDRPSFDYDLQTVAGIANPLFRGPAVDLSRPYIACIGAAQTFGRFCNHPFTALLADALGIQVLNLGVGGAGPRLFDSSEYLWMLNRAEVVIVQVLSGRSESNTLFDNSKSGNLYGVRIGNNKPMRFEEFLREIVTQESPALVKRVVQETREQYVQKMIALLRRISRPKVLFWFSSRPPDYEPDFSSAPGILGAFPQLVDRSMLNEIRPHSDAYVECVSNRGLPQKLWRADHAVDGTTLEKGVLINRYYPSPEMQVEAAGLLAPACQQLLSEHRMKAQTAQPAAAIAGTRFLVLCAERTGSSMLVGLLGSHRDCFVAGELFNPRLIAKGHLAGWPNLKDRELLALRQADPVSFISRVFETIVDRGYRAAGFKLMYQHSQMQPAATEYLVSQKDIRVIHLKRRNLLRRLLSERRAQSTDVWSETPDASGSQPPSVDLPFLNSAWNFAHIESKQSEYEERFKSHPVLELFYEDLANDPQAVGACALEFVGLRPEGPLEIRFKKTGTDPLRQAIANYDDLKAQFLRWASFFEE